MFISGPVGSRRGDERLWQTQALADGARAGRLRRQCASSSALRCCCCTSTASPAGWGLHKYQHLQGPLPPRPLGVANLKLLKGSKWNPEELGKNNSWKASWWSSLAPEKATTLDPRVGSDIGMLQKTLTQSDLNKKEMYYFSRLEVGWSPGPVWCH